MARIEQTEQPRGTTGGSSYSETPEQKRGWAKLADWIEESLDDGTLIEGDTFKVKGYVQKMELDNGKFFTKKFKDRNTDEEKTTTTTKTTAVIDDRRFTPAGVLLPLPTKDLGTSFFDGRMRDGTRGIARGSMYHLHLAVTYQEPPPELVSNRGSWDTDDYTGPEHPVLLVVTFAGWEPEGSQYHNSRASLKVFLDKFERDLEAKKAAPSGGGRSGRRPMVADPEPEEVAEQQDPPFAPTGDEFDDDPEPPTPPAARGGSGRTSGRSRTTDGPGASGSTGRGTEPAMRIVDAPVDLAANPTRGRSRAGSAGAGAGDSATAASTATASGADHPATERQVKFIHAIAREAGLDEQELAAWCQELYGTSEVGQLNRRDASTLIEALQRRRNEVA